MLKIKINLITSFLIKRHCKLQTVCVLVSELSAAGSCSGTEEDCRGQCPGS